MDKKVLPADQMSWPSEEWQKLWPDANKDGEIPTAKRLPDGTALPGIYTINAPIEFIVYDVPTDSLQISASHMGMNIAVRIPAAQALRLSEMFKGLQEQAKRDAGEHNGEEP